MRKKIITAIIFMGIVLSFVSVFSIKCIAPTPNIPVVFTATTISKTQIDLAWTMGEKADTTIIERNTSGVTTWVRGAGTQIYSGSLLFYSDTELIQGTTYYYQAWSWNQTDNMYSSNSANRFNTTFTTNQAPFFGLPLPSDGSTNNPLSLIWSIPINDPEGDTFTWTIQCSNGQQTGSSGASNGTQKLSLFGLAYSTTYTVLVDANDQGSGLNTSGSYTFTTEVKGNNPPVFGTPSPANGSTANPVSLTWNISINDPEGNTFNWVIQCSNGQTNDSQGVSNGTKSLFLSGLAYSTTYTVWVSATDPAPDGSKQDTQRWYTFTTKGNTPPVFGTPSPGNSSTGNPQSLTWTIPISDVDGDLFSWTIECNNAQTTSETNAANGTKSLTLSGLVFSTTYTVWVNATDPTGSGLYTKKWYTITIKNPGGGGGGGPPAEPENKKPIADVSADEPYKGFVNATIRFNGSRSYDPDGTITKWSWAFGDNTSGTGKTVNHTFSKTGTYTVTLTITDDEGATNTDTTTCMISKRTNRPPTPPIIKGPTNGTKNTIYKYSALSTDLDDDTIQYTFTWGDPISLPQSSGFISNGSGFAVNHSWVNVGRYEVTVTVTDNQTTSSSKITVYIDAVQTGNIGYLYDDDNDGIYDAFYSDSLKQITTTVQSQDGSYNIDYNGDGKWDYIFGTSNELAKYQEPPPDIQFLFIIGAIVLVSIWAILVSLWMRKTKEQN